MKKLNKNEMYILLIFITLLIIGIFYTIINYDKIMNKEVHIKYSDGCKEIYKDGILTTPSCEINVIKNFDQYIEYKNE